MTAGYILLAIVLAPFVWLFTYAYLVDQAEQGKRGIR